MTISRRTTVAGVLSGQKRFSAGSSWAPYEQSFTAREVLTSTGHDISRLGTGDQGGAFSVTRIGYTHLSAASLDTPTIHGTAVGNSCPGVTLFSKPSDLSISAFNALGAKMVASSSPVAPQVSLRNFLAEIVVPGGSPRMFGATLKEQTRVAHKAGSEYLNYQFGWLPLMSDLRKIVKTAQKASVSLEQYRHNANKPIRRRNAMTLISEQRSTTGLMYFTPNANDGSGSLHQERFQNVWFVGKFRYFVPMGDDLVSRFVRYNQYAHRLFGAGPIPSPAQVWDAAPWSWLVDWFSDVGDVVQNVSDLGLNGLVMQYGYAMCHSGTTRTYLGTHSQTGASSSLTYTHESKMRIAANPYGFGLTDKSLSKTQLAILGALGLTQGQRTR